MNPNGLRELVNEASNEYNNAAIEYNKRLLDYGVGLLAAELSVVGFLLQNSTSQGLISNSIGTKVSYLILLSLTSLSIIASTIAKRLQRDYKKNIMYSHQYRAMSNPNIDVTIDGFARPPHAADDENIPVYTLKAWKCSHWARRLYDTAEFLLTATLVAAVVFVVILIVRL